MNDDVAALSAMIHSHTLCGAAKADGLAEAILRSKWLEQRDLRTYANGEADGRRQGVVEGERAGRYRGIAVGMMTRR